MSSQISNNLVNSLDLSSEFQLMAKTKIMKNVTYVCCLEQKILHYCMKTSYMEVFVKRVKTVY